MVFTRHALLFLLATLMTACSTVPRSSLPDSDAQMDEVSAEGFQPLPDPYLSQRRPLPREASGLFEQAQQAMRAGDWQQARTILEEMTQKWPNLSGPWVNLGLVYRELNQYEQAEQAFEQAIDVNALNSEAYNQLAVLRREQGEFDEAEKLYRQALEVWPHNPVVHRNLGILYDLYMGRFADALNHYRMSQQVASEPEKRVEGWIVDLERRLAERQAALKQEN